MINRSKVKRMPGHDVILPSITDTKLIQQHKFPQFQNRCNQISGIITDKGPGLIQL